jgi:hypothetical protein
MTRKTTKYEAIATYCWSHGTLFDRSHNSATCPDPKRGNIRKATIYYNQQGGSIAVTTPEKWRTKRPTTTRQERT